MSLPVTTVEVVLADAGDALAVLDALQRAGAMVLELHDDVVPARVFAGFDGPVGDDVIAGIPHARAEVRPARSVDWGSTWEGRVKSVQVGPLRVVPPGRDDVDPGSAVRLVDIGAFGSGVHPTTMLCLARMAELADNGLMPERVLDVGTGSGVLALAALRLGAKHAVGTDLDESALESARINAKENGLTRRITLQEALPDERFGLVVANIVAATLTELAPALSRVVAPKGTLLLSGIWKSQALDVRAAFVRVGFRAAPIHDDGEWALLEFLSGW